MIGNEVYFIIDGSANVLILGEDKNYLNNKAMYNEISLTRSKSKTNHLSR